MPQSTMTDICMESGIDDGHSKSLLTHSLIQEAMKVGRLHVEWVTPNVHQEAWNLFENYADQMFSFVDCTSLIIASRHGIDEIFGFDEQFALWPWS